MHCSCSQYRFPHIKTSSIPTFPQDAMQLALVLMNKYMEGAGQDCAVKVVEIDG